MHFKAATSFWLFWATLGLSRQVSHVRWKQPIKICSNALHITSGVATLSTALGVSVSHLTPTPQVFLISVPWFRCPSRLKLIWQIMSRLCSCSEQQGTTSCGAKDKKEKLSKGVCSPLYLSVRIRVYTVFYMSRRCTLNLSLLESTFSFEYRSFAITSLSSTDWFPRAHSHRCRAVALSPSGSRTAVVTRGSKKCRLAEFRNKRARLCQRGMMLGKNCL